MNICELFDSYRDCELDSPRRTEFELHLRSCSECRLAHTLLNNLVTSITTAEPSIPSDLAERIAARAFRQKTSWDKCIVSWLQPQPAWVAVALVLFILSGVYVIPDRRSRNDLYTEYEALWKSSTSGYALLTDDDFVRWVGRDKGMR